MNDLPYAFYESVFWVACTARALVVSRLSKIGQQLSGNIGIVAQQMTSLFKAHVVAIDNSQIIRERRWSWNGEVPKNLRIKKDKFVYCVTICIFENNEDKVSNENIDRICFPNAAHCLSLQTATVSKAWIDWACTAKQLTGLGIRENLSDEAITLCKRLIETGHLSQLAIESKAPSEEVMEMVKLSLIQPRFKSVRFMEDRHLEELLVFWARNKKALRGKDLCLYFETSNRIKFLEDKLELCPQEEFDPISRHHFYFPRSLFTKPSHPYKLKYGGDDRDSNSAYVFFECCQQKANESEMSCLAKMPQIGILFT